MNLIYLEYMIYVNNSNLEIFGKYIPRLTYHSKICRIRNLRITINLKSVKIRIYILL